MTWSDQVASSRQQLAAVRPLQGARRPKLAPAGPPSSNSSLGALSVATGLVAAALFWSREGHKLQGRRLPPLLERLRRLLTGGGGSGSGRRAALGPAGGGDVDAWKQLPASSLAAAAAEQRLQQQQQQEKPQARRCRAGRACTSLAAVLLGGCQLIAPHPHTAPFNTPRRCRRRRHPRVAAAAAVAAGRKSPSRRRRSGERESGKGRGARCCCPLRFQCKL